MKVLFKEKGSDHLAVIECTSISLYDDHSAVVFNTSFGRTYTLGVFMFKGAYRVLSDSGDKVSAESIIRQAFAADTLDLSNYTLVEEYDTDEE